MIQEHTREYEIGLGTRLFLVSIRVQVEEEDPVHLPGVEPKRSAGCYKIELESVLEADEDGDYVLTRLSEAERAKLLQAAEEAFWGEAETAYCKDRD